MRHSPQSLLPLLRLDWRFPISIHFFPSLSVLPDFHTGHAIFHFFFHLVLFCFTQIHQIASQTPFWFAACKHLIATFVRYHKLSQTTLTFNFTPFSVTNRQPMQPVPPVPLPRCKLVCSCIPQHCWDRRCTKWYQHYIPLIWFCCSVR